MKSLLKLAVPLLIISSIAWITSGQKKPSQQSKVENRPQCKIERKDKVVNINCLDGWSGQIIAAGRDRVWFKWKEKGQTQDQAKLVERSADKQLHLVSIDRRVQCLQPKDVCACNKQDPTRPEKEWCDLPPCCPGFPQLCNSDAANAGCAEPGRASFDFCGFLSGGCNDNFTRVAGVSANFCVTHALGCG